jgi:hypothetical protein
MRFKPSRLNVVVACCAVLIVLAGSGAIASNMGFKLNKPLYPGPAPAGQNWVSLPFTKPYITYADLCAQLGLPNLTTTVLQRIPETGAAQSCLCGTAACTPLKLDLSNLPAASLVSGVPAPYLAVRITGNGLVATGNIIVGSHNPTMSVLLRRPPNPSNAACCPVANPADRGTCSNAPATVCCTNADCVAPGTCNVTGSVAETWFSVPYHTTALTANDICTQAGIPAGGAAVNVVNPQTGATTNGTCGFSTANFNLVLGQALRIRRTGVTAAANCPATSFIPAHF